MTYKELLDLGISELKKSKIIESESDGKLLLLYILNINLAKLYMIFPEQSKKVEIKKYKKCIKNRKKNIPVQYIIGFQEFMSLKFNVNKNVLIPRQDTETLVEYIIKKSSEYKENPIKILDIGTGSGAISISLGKYIENSYIYGTDISNKALKVAKLNGDINNVSNKLEFKKSNLFKNIKEIKFNIIVSNPPYIKKKEKKDMERYVLKEPRRALFSHKDGYYHIEKIIDGGKKYLEINGLLAIEVGYNQSNKTVELFTKNGYTDIEIIKDYNGIERVISGKYCGGVI